MQESGGISNDIRIFLTRNINSIQQLEVLLLLASDPKHWTPEELSTTLKINPASASNRLMNLWAKDLIMVKEGPPRAYFYVADNGPVDRVIQKIRAIYKDQREEVIEIVSCGTTGQIKSLSDAFKFKKREDKNG